ncbi:hypothetical protein PPMP20_32890 [Paraburkholderia phymatum]|uniref:Uncharacterized protein n=1 Tax=Paraburkholderia phymatum (strain DSM 17167 / CIP 108236 / LMG 21445 / STM815) TaxID=391038 RepID=B2JI08_PARP8|nr:hypothetical protein [Paraburkholderia phymatum]ACC71954.1 hypothetical protein Bphy_2782 [Paraburkholderia phymatum STM815]
MTVQNNHFTTQLQSVARPAAADKTSSRSSTTAAASSTGDKASTPQTSASPVGLVGNHVNTTA